MAKKIVIIGGGVAGLSAGIYASLNGLDSEIIEMHSITGGQCTAWDRKGYRFDYCLHWLVGTRNGTFNDIWRETDVINENVEIIDHEVHTKINSEDGREFIIYTDLNRWEQYLINFAPEDEKKIKKMCRDMRKSSFLQPFSDPPGLRKFGQTITSMFGMMPIMTLFMKYGRKSCEEYFRTLGFENESLKFFLNSMFGSLDFSALAFIMMFAWFNQKNAGYLTGGSLPLAQRMTKRYLHLGGKLRTRSKVSEIVVENNKAKGVLLSDGTEIMADYVISAADGHSTIFNMLGGKYLNKKISNAYQNWKLFTPIVQVSFGIAKIIESKVHSESWLMKDKKIEKEQIEKESMFILENHYPGIRAFIEVCDVATPVTDVNYTGVWKGSYEGFLPSSKNLMDNLKPTLPGLKNFYMAGQWLSPGGGLPPAGQTGKWAVQYICREEKTRFKTN